MATVISALENGLIILLTIIIISCDAEAGAITSSDTLRSYQGGNVLNISLSPSYSDSGDPGASFSYAYIIASKTTGKILQPLRTKLSLFVGTQAIVTDTEYIILNPP